MRSWVVTNGWVKLVTINGDVKLRCTICRQDFNYASNNTSAAMRHVQKHHRATETSSPETNSRQQSSIQAAFDMQEQRIRGQPAKSLEELIVDFFVEAKLPFLTVEKASLQRLLNYLSLHRV
jgi:hypothetical protein